MTKIVCDIIFDKDQRNCNVMLEASGHATGSVEACAGVSAIVEALNAYVQVSVHVSETYEHIVEPGHFVIRASGDVVLGEVWRMACIGLKRIALSYPKQVSVTSKTT